LYKNILLKKEEGVATITVNRPEARNALNIETRQELLSALDDIAKDDSIKVAVLTGAGEKAFIAGADIKVFQEFNAPSVLDYSYELGSMGLYRKVRELEKPTIAAINGYALGGGCEIAMCCDIRIAAENASFGQPEINIGIIPGGGGTQLLPRIIGIGRAKELCFTGDMIDAREAERFGLVNKVVPLDKLEEEVMNLAQKIASKSPLILKYIKRSINLSMQTGLDAGLAFESQTLSTCFDTEDKEEGVSAFIEKRKPQFKGK